MKIIKAFGFLIIIILVLFVISVIKYQQLINEGSAIVEKQCMEVNSTIVDRHNSYKDLMSTQIGSPSAIMEKLGDYMRLTKTYIEAQKVVLVEYENYLNRKDFNLFVPKEVRSSFHLQYESYEADMRLKELILQMYSPSFKELSRDVKDSIVANIAGEIKRRDQANRDYLKSLEDSAKIFDLRSKFVKIPESKCPPENFDIPETTEFSDKPTT